MATPTNLPAAQTTGNVLTAAYMNDLRGAFRILQVVQATYSTQVSSSTTTLVDTGLTATITPQSTSSKVLVIVHQAGIEKTSNNLNSAVRIALLRGATNISTPVDGACYTNTAITLNIGSQHFTFLDSPNTISATTYKTQFCNIGIATAAVKVQSTFGLTPESTITLMEISA
jgi:hypothetical protein